MKKIAVLGAGQNSGKTTTVEALIQELKKRGFTVATIKQIHKVHFTLDQPQKDSWRHQKAGADLVVTAAPQEIAVLKKISEKNRFQEAFALLQNQNIDFLLIEGDPQVGGIVKIYAARDQDIPESKLPLSQNSIVALVSLSPENFQNPSQTAFWNTLPVFHSTKETPKLVDFLLTQKID